MHLHVQMDQIVFILSHVHCLKLKSRVRNEKIKQNKIKIKTWKQFGCDHNYGPAINKIMNCNEDVWTLRLSSYTMAQLR